jgi:hypothetical protein
VNFDCPACKRPIINRRRNLCAYCGATLPSALLFTSVEIARLDKMEQEEEARRAERKKREKEADEARRSADSGPDLL